MNEGLSYLFTGCPNT